MAAIDDVAGPQDMAAIVSFIDPSQDAAHLKWWKQATNSCGAQGMADAVSPCCTALCYTPFSPQIDPKLLKCPFWCPIRTRAGNTEVIETI